MYFTGRQHTLEHAGTKPFCGGGTIADRAARHTAVLALLTAEDRRLATLVHVEARTLKSAAAELGQPVYAVSRRAKRLKAVLECPTRRAIAANLHALVGDRRQLAVDHLFRGVPVVLLARHRGVGRSVVQRELDYIRGWARAYQHADRVGELT